MQFHSFQFVFFLLSVTTKLTKAVNKDQDISIVILRELQQDDIVTIFAKSIAEFEKRENIHVSLNYVVIADDNLIEGLAEFCQIVSNEFAIIIDITWEPLWPSIIDYIRATGAPYLRGDLSIRPFVRAFLKFIECSNTFDAAMVFHNEKGQYEGIYEVLNQYSIRSITYDGINQTIADRIINLRPMPTNFVIFAPTTDMEILFEKAEMYKVIERPNRWRLVYLDFVSQAKIHAINKHYPEINIFAPTNEMCCVYLGHDRTQVKHCDCLQKISFLEVYVKELFNKIFAELQVNNFERYTLDCSNGGNELISTEKMSITSFENQLAGVVLASSTILFTKNSTYSVEYYLNLAVVGRENNDEPLRDDETPVISELAVINNAGVMVTSNVTIKAPRRFFRIGISPALPWTYTKINPHTLKPAVDENSNVIWEVYCVDFAKKLAEMLNFDYELVLPKSGAFGDRIPHLNNTWDGLVGELMVGNIDIAVTAMKMTAEREEVIDFVAPYYDQTGISIVIRKPVRQTSLFKFMTVLRLEVWLSIVGAIIMTAIMLWLLDKYSPYSAKNNKQAYPYECRDFTFKESLWFAMTSFTPQGGGEAPKALSSRTLVAAYWLFVVLMLATFTANLAAFLTVERMQTPVQSLDQLARQSRINYTVVESSDTHKYFINMKFAEDTLYRMWKEITLNSSSDQTQYRVWDYPIKEQYGRILLAINSSNPVATAEDGFRNVNEHENADYAFIHDSAEIKYEISKNCNLTEVGEVFAEQPYAVAIQQGSQLQDEISRSILELQKDRFFEILIAKYWNHSNKADCSNSDENEGITLESLGGVFIATLFGLALAMITLVIEVFYYRQRDIRQNTVIPIENNEQTITPPPSYEDNNLTRRQKRFNIFKRKAEQVTIGDTFVPASITNTSRVSYISVYPRKPIHSLQCGTLID